MNSKQNRYLTKSRFKLALSCITQLYYTGKPKEYTDQSLNDEFLEALAKGGYQVGELAKYYFCDDPVKDGIIIDSLDYETSLKETERRLRQPGKIVIVEAAFRYKNLFVRTDLVVREGNTLHVYEVKAKSYEPGEDFLNKKGTGILGEWREYVYDVAFQRFVITNALADSGLTIKTYLMLVDKSKATSVDGLNQFFRVYAEGKRKKVVVRPGLKKKDLGNQILVAIPTDDECDKIINEFAFPTDISDTISFEDFVWKSADLYYKDERLFTPVGSKCKRCSFTTGSNEQNGLKSGFHECWLNATGLKLLDKPLVTELWNGLAGGRSYTDELVHLDKHFLHLIEEQDIAAKSIKERSIPGLIPHERRMEQINRIKSGNNQSYFDADGLKNEMQNWKYPLHLIDFETSAVAIPFFKGAHPYEGIAFQFSHHIIDKDWNIRHATQFLSFEIGAFPNFKFVEALRVALSNDNGTIFRYHNHENTYLNFILNQIQTCTIPPPNKNQLVNFILEITREGAERKGKRDMVDLYDLVIRYYYPPHAKGSNSLKAILPAIIADSEFLREKYSRKGVYGKGKEVKSLNFDDHVWIDPAVNNNPYKTLPRVFPEYDPETLDSLVVEFENVADGGAAMTAYNYLQFSEIPTKQREHIRDSLLRYCELDTMAMVMLLEGWKNKLL